MRLLSLQCMIVPLSLIFNYHESAAFTTPAPTSPSPLLSLNRHLPLTPLSSPSSSSSSSSVNNFQQSGCYKKRYDHALNASPIAAAALFSSTSKVAATATAAATSSSSSLSLLSLLPHNNLFYVLSSVLLLSTSGIILEKRTTIGKALSVSA